MATVKQILAMSASERDALNQSILATLKGVPCAAAEFHAAQLKGWQVKLCGPKPTPEMVAFNYVIDGGRRAGNEPMWPAMTLRADGATVGEFMRATSAGGAAHNNAAKYNTERNGAGWLVRVPLPNDERAGRWQHVITDKGAAQLAKRVAALTGTAEVKAKPVKVARKVNAKPVTEVPAEPVAVNEPATADQLAALAAQFNGWTVRTLQTRITARRNARREHQLAPLAAWQARTYYAQVTLLDGDFDGEPVLPPTAAEHYKLEQWLRQNKPPQL